MILADMGLDEEPHRAAGRRHPADRAGGAEREIADPTNIDNGAVGADRFERPRQRGDHRAALQARFVAL